MDTYLKDVLEQGTVMRACLARYGDQENRALFEQIAQTNKRRILFCGMGSSNFCSYPAFLDLTNAGFQVNMESAAQILHYGKGLLSAETLVVLVSQSGESGEIVKIIQRLPPEVRVVAITNFPHSTLGLRANFTLQMHLEPEEAVSTRTYLSSIMLSGLLATALRKASLPDYLGRLEQAVSTLEAFIASRGEYEEKLGQFLDQPGAFALIGRGYSLSTVRAGALFTRECAKFQALDFDSGEFRHGPFEMVDPNFSAMIFAPSGATHELQTRLAFDIMARGGKVVIISGRKLEIDDPLCMVIHTGEVEEAMSPLVDIVPVQLYARMLAQFRGFIPGQFRWSSKVTSRE